jgi:hypothetical protein
MNTSPPMVSTLPMLGADFIPITRRIHPESNSAIGMELRLRMVISLVIGFALPKQLHLRLLAFHRFRANSLNRNPFLALLPSTSAMKSLLLPVASIVFAATPAAMALTSE